MAGAPSQLDLFDHKPMLQKHDGEEIPAGIIPEGERFAFVKGTPRLLGSPFEFQPRGQSGNEISELLPFLQQHADEIAIIRSMKTTQFNHAPAQIFMNTGHQVIGRPSMGSWLSYGLGSDNKDLPAFVVLMSGQNNPDGGKSCWGSGFLPTVHQGVEFRAKGEPVLFSRNPDGVDGQTRRESLDLIRALNTLEGATRRRSGNHHSYRRLRNGVPDAVERPGAYRHLRENRRRRTRCTAPSPARCRSATTACSRAAWSNAACASSSSITAGGTPTAPASATTSSCAYRSCACRSTAPSAGCSRT